jgi:hypothetical protein
MSEMVERVSKAICCPSGVCGAQGALYNPIRGQVSICQAHTFRADARAAIEATLEPTADMIDAMRDIGPDAPYGAAETAERWRAGVRAALKNA